jgi:hypothetical protein
VRIQVQQSAKSERRGHCSHCEGQSADFVDEMQIRHWGWNSTHIGWEMILIAISINFCIILELTYRRRDHWCSLWESGHLPLSSGCWSSVEEERRHLVRDLLVRYQQAMSDSSSARMMEDRVEVCHCLGTKQLHFGVERRLDHGGWMVGLEKSSSAMSALVWQIESCAGVGAMATTSWQYC